MRRSYPDCAMCRRLGANLVVAENLLGQVARQQAHSAYPHRFVRRIAKARFDVQQSKQIFDTHQAECLVAQTTE